MSGFFTGRNPRHHPQKNQAVASPGSGTFLERLRLCLFAVTVGQGASAMTAQAKIQPLCDRDQSPMSETILEDQLIEHPFPAHRCQRSDCTRAYTESLGYFNVEGSGILLDKFGKQTCPNCEASMYLAAYNPETEDETWRCARCGQERLAA